ncbi:MAG TPA: cytochrome P450 [Ideonella sp.]|uniref:cytochrome P450 n=1 Tax=Ideonella sp. TaxID=1929293 RepID=UPI002E330293|nr:cytochrome P450 [Ideonella sp.]HEX5684502.1 cytochrome P450 [Ideonella sp.]
MEANTFTTTVYAATGDNKAFAYLRHLPHLNEWTLGSRMVTRIDDDTWMGTASGYQTMLCYHVRPLEHPNFLAIEWQCGYRYREYFKQYPVFVFPSRYVDPQGDESGSYIHWISVIDPVRRTPMIMQGIAAVHQYEGRGLKAALERREQLGAPAPGRWRIETDTMYVDAPIELAVAELNDPSRLPLWAPMFRPDPRGDGRDFFDEYDRRVRVTFTPHLLDDYMLVEQDYAYPDQAVVHRHPIVLIPSSRAFSPAASGFLLHRIGFWDNRAAPSCGRLGPQELAAENMAIKRRVEAAAGNLAAFARGMSYAAESCAAATPANHTDGSHAPPDIFSPAFADDPYPAYRRMRDDHPLYFHGPSQAWILSRYEDVQAALRLPEFTTHSYAAQTEPLLGRTIIQLDGHEHNLQRLLLAPAFRGASIQQRWQAAIERVVDELVAGLVGQREPCLVRDFAAQLPVRMMVTILGLPVADRERFRGWYAGLIRAALNLQRDPAVARAGERARAELGGYLRPLIARRRRDPGDDLISQLTQAEVEGRRLADEEIVRFGMLMVFAAGETTEKALSTTLRNLIAHPEQLARVRADSSLVPRAVAESLRYTAPTHMVPRRTSAEVRVSGGVLPTGAEVMCFLGAANRDERRFGDPDRFDIDRPEADPELAFGPKAAHLAFGHGRHFCLGAMLSKFETCIAIERLLAATRDLRFAGGQAPPDGGLFLRGPSTLPVEITCSHRG